MNTSLSSSLGTAAVVNYDGSTGALMLEHLAVSDSAVTAECRHWSAGVHGEAVPDADLQRADLSAFAVAALTIGARAMSAAGGVQQAYGVENLIGEVERRATQASEDAAARTAKVVTEASATLSKASTEAQRHFVDASVNARKAFTESVQCARTDLDRQLAALFGGEEPQVMARLQPLLERFSSSLQTQAVQQTSLLIEKMARQFDPSDPTSPMAKQLKSLTETQAGYAKAAADQQRSLAEKVEALTVSMAVTKARDLALAKSAAKGATYEEQVHAVVAELAAGLGDEYQETGNVVGLRTRSKKGDGVLIMPDTDSRVVVEMTDSPRSTWSAYLQEAEANRGAHASLGLVRHSEQLPGGPILTFGPRRIVMAFDPETDSVYLLRCVLQLLRLAASAAVSRVDSGELATVDERLSEALESLETIGKIKKTADQVHQAGLSIGTDAASLEAGLVRLLSQARSALSGVIAERHDDVA